MIKLWPYFVFVNRIVSEEHSAAIFRMTELFIAGAQMIRLQIKNENHVTADVQIVPLGVKPLVGLNTIFWSTCLIPLCVNFGSTFLTTLRGLGDLKLHHVSRL